MNPVVVEKPERAGDMPAPLSRPRLPDWLRIKLPTSDTFSHTRSLLDELKLHTVCESAKCPNHWECWSRGTATFMIAGDRCTRACGFCAVSTAKPFALEADEPARVKCGWSQARTQEERFRRRWNRFEVKHPCDAFRSKVEWFR